MADEGGGPQPAGLLAGMRVLDAGIWRPAPHATQLLADLGAEVVKLEPPGGDPMRAYPEVFAGIASHKRSVVVDLRDDADRERALRLAAEADVFVEGWRPGVADRLGLGEAALRALNPPIVYCSLSGYGQTGPRRDLPGHDLDYQAAAGFLVDAEGRPTGVPTVPVADLAGGTVAALLVAAAWARRLRTGEGERIDVAMADVLATWRGTSSGTAVAGQAERVRGLAGYGVYECADGGAVALGVISEPHLWAAVCDGLGLADLRGLDLSARVGRRAELDSRVAGAVRSMGRDEAVTRLAAAGAPVAPVLAPHELVSDPQLRARGLVHDTRSGPVLGFPARLARHPPRPPGRTPEPGEHDGFSW